MRRHSSDAETRFIRCQRKQQLTYQRAREIAKRQRRRDDSKTSEYFCHDCKAWHVGERFD